MVIAHISSSSDLLPLQIISVLSAIATIVAAALRTATAAIALRRGTIAARLRGDGLLAVARLVVDRGLTFIA